MVRFGYILILFGFTASVSAFASTQQATPSTQTAASARQLYKQQCTEVGGSVNGFCMCEGQQDLLVLAANVVSVAKDVTKISQKTFQIINPFTQSCNGKPAALNVSLQRLEKIHSITVSLTQNPEFQEKIFLMDELDLFHPDVFSKYMTNGKFQKDMLKKVKKLRSTQEKLVKSGITGTARTLAQDKAKLAAIAAIEDFTGWNIKNTITVTNQVKSFMTAAMQKSTTESIATSLKNMGKNFVKTSAKALGKGLVAGLIMTAGLETISYVTGYDVTVFDPFQVFLPTPAGDGTISGALNKKISLTLYPEYQKSLDMGFFTEPDLFSSKLVLMSMMTESLSKGENLFGFLDE